MKTEHVTENLQVKDLTSFLNEVGANLIQTLFKGCFVGNQHALIMSVVLAQSTEHIHHGRLTRHKNHIPNKNEIINICSNSILETVKRV